MLAKAWAWLIRMEGINKQASMAFHALSVAHPEMISDACHEAGLPHEIEFQPDLRSQLVHRGREIKLELRLLQEDSSSPDLDQILSHRWQRPRVLDLDCHQAIWTEPSKLLLCLGSMYLQAAKKSLEMTLAAL